MPARGPVVLGIGGLTLDGVDRTQQLLVSLGAIKSPVKSDEVATTQFVDAAVKDLGPSH